VGPVEGKRVLITGGTGSFGNFILRELLTRHAPKEVRIFSRDEFKQSEMRRDFPTITYIIGDTRDRDSLQRALKQVEIVYHAAALKHIPLYEENPMESIKTNILATHNLINACREEGVSKAILISTDKAVKPVNVYGMCKAISERLFVTADGEETEFVCMRYGNVVGSRGSVIPLFKKLVENGNPLPITHPEMTRFLITLRQAAELALFCTASSLPSKIVTMRLPACRIVDLAKAMAGEGFPMQIVGPRRGEKIHECLVSEEEINRTSSIGEYLVIDQDRLVQEPALSSEFGSDSTIHLTVPEIRDLLQREGWLPTLRMETRRR